MTEFGKGHITIRATDDPDPDAGNAHHQYEISVGRPDAPPLSTVIMFQHGPIKEAGVNGINEWALLAILLDRYRAFQTSKWACPENEATIEKLEGAMYQQVRRTLDRGKRNVEGTNEI